MSMSSTDPPAPRILIVEDEAITALDLENEIRDMGYEVCGIADTADEAERLVREHAPDLILMDVRLAGSGDGIDAAHRISAIHNAAVVFLSAHSDGATLERALDASPFGYIIKPFRAIELKVTLDVALSKRLKDLEGSRQLEELAATEPLTGLGNRRKFDEVIDIEWRRCRREKACLGLLMVDIDRFKAFNDLYGHAVGDECLKTVARILANHCCRPADSVCRWGGDEFAAILPGTDQQGVDFLAKHLVRMVEGAGVPNEAWPACPLVTVSIGAASLLPADGDDVGGLLGLADAALYEAKRRGGNCFSGAGK
ncbi:MAG: diguanylate cyclase [Chthoniobacterales bacterium]|nr:diguanylate cyclase [Chthoniobacterales bacterium]